MSHTQPSPTAGPAQHHPGVMVAHPPVNGHMPPAAIPAQGQKGVPLTTPQKIAALNEQVWLQIGSLTELMGDLDGAMNAYEQALRHNQWSIPAMNAISCILRTKEQFPKAIEYLQNILKLDPTSGETWGSLGHCHLMMDNLQEAYTSYQQALYHLRDPKPKLWYGIGILYDRYGSLDHAEEAFSQVMRMAPEFEKANEIYFRLGIIYKQQQKFSQSLDVTAYRRVLERDPNHAKVLQQLGWLYHQQSNSYESQERAIEYLEKSVSADNNDAQSWYLLGRCYMSQAKYPKAYEAYQQAVYRDGRNPTFWCSIGVLYYQINQYRDALDAYSRAIRLNPYISEVWYDLGTLYESCNNQIADALDAYGRAADLDPTNVHIKARLQLLQSQLSGSAQQNNAPAPQPQDVHPQAYQAPGVGAPPAPQWGGPAPAAAPAPVGPPPQAPAPPRQIDWSRGASDLHPQQAPPLAAGNGVDQREAMRGPGVSQASPRQDPGRAFPDPSRPGASTRSPKMAGSGAYPPHHTLPQLGNGPAPTHERGPSGGNPPFGSAGRGHLPPAPVGAPAPGPNAGVAPGAPAPPYAHRPFTPPTEIRPIRDERPSSPGAGYPHQQYHHGPLAPAPPGAPTGIATGAPPPASASNAADAAARDRVDDRPPSAMKRGREWESEAGPIKKQASDETRARLDDQNSRRPSPPARLPSPGQMQRRSSSEARREDTRRANDNYHPSEAAHHPPTLPSIQSMPPHAAGGPGLPPMAEGTAPPPSASNGPPPSAPPAARTPVKEEAPRPEAPASHEPAARKMDVDEDYDDDGDDEKKVGGVAKASPNGSAAGAGPNVMGNGRQGTPSKTETA
ncbi:General transcriptional corepressor ssn6 [Penicillium diatomitis]|uniref:General transcriptional corepressor ssn6 n=1 Tax=Penicillium diatomitis TaxID=2819901 RepID=A0A9X0BU29_9EURO|nr:General transcriptional corepressor ssn6 [Penicillium diatomitis]KAJ5484091.1 General transcriptional corepressor ssn6 [Penicillium diatomitis]